MPGGSVGGAKEARGKTAFPPSLQTPQQHNHPEKDTSKICTAHALLANMAATYAFYHGPEGLKQIAHRIHCLTLVLAHGLLKLGFEAGSAQGLPRFDTLTVSLGNRRALDILKLAEQHRINFRSIDEQTLGISLDETTTEQDV